MGATGSREIVVPLGTNPLSLPSTDAARKRAEDTYKAAEDSIFQEGYRQGVRDTTARYTEGAELAARAAYSRLLVSEEGRKGEEVEAAAAALRKSQYRCVRLARFGGWGYTSWPTFFFFLCLALVAIMNATNLLVQLLCHPNPRLLFS
jgi:hypothetical protein